MCIGRKGSFCDFTEEWIAIDLCHCLIGQLPGAGNCPSSPGVGNGGDRGGSRYPFLCPYPLIGRQDSTSNVKFRCKHV